MFLFIGQVLPGRKRKLLGLRALTLSDEEKLISKRGRGSEGEICVQSTLDTLRLDTTLK